MLLFVMVVFHYIASIRGTYYTQTVIDESATYDPMDGAAFKGGWVDSLGTVYFAKPSALAVQTLTPAGNMSFIIGPSAKQNTSGESGPATSVQVDGVHSIYGDTSGNLYMSSDMYFIWKYDRPSGIVSRIAGATPAALGFSGDGGKATAATLNGPRGLFLDSNGILFVADVGNNRIRTIETATGIINTFAGNNIAGFGGDLGPATSASLDFPSSVWGSSDGTVYIAEVYNYRIRRIDSSGIITTFAGTGDVGYNGETIPATSARINVYSVSGDSNGNIFIASSGRVLKVKSGSLSTIAGDGNMGKVSQILKPANLAIPFPNSVFADPVGGVIYFTAVSSANKLFDTVLTPRPSSAPTYALTNAPTDSPTTTPSYQLTRTPTISPTNPPVTPSVIPSFRPSSSPTNHNNQNNSTLNSDSHSNERMSDLHIFYATFFPAFFVLCGMLLGVLVYVLCYRKKNQEKENSPVSEMNASDMVVVEGEGVVVVKKERYYEMWF